MLNSLNKITLLSYLIKVMNLSLTRIFTLFPSVYKCACLCIHVSTCLSTFSYICICLYVSRSRQTGWSGLGLGATQAGVVLTEEEGRSPAGACGAAATSRPWETTTVRTLTPVLNPLLKPLLSPRERPSDALSAWTTGHLSTSNGEGGGGGSFYNLLNLLRHWWWWWWWGWWWRWGRGVWWVLFSFYSVCVCGVCRYSCKQCVDATLPYAHNISTPKSHARSRSYTRSLTSSQVRPQHLQNTVCLYVYSSLHILASVPLLAPNLDSNQGPFADIDNSHPRSIIIHRSTKAATFKIREDNLCIY